MTQSEFELIWRDGSDSVECHTSGSTGKPKTICLSKDFMKESARRSNLFFGIFSGSRLHTCLDFEYIASKMMTVRRDEARCLLTSEIPSNRPLSGVEKDARIDLLSVVPSQLEWILDAEDKWSGVRNILVGGAPVPLSLRERISRSGYEVWESYGMTETASHIALRKVGCDDGIPFETLPGITVSLSESGCLAVDMPRLNKIVTNDLAEVYSPTKFRILGRADNCIISGGIKIMPEEVERVLAPFIKRDFYLSSVPDTKWGERLVLVVAEKDFDRERSEIIREVESSLGECRTILKLGARFPKEVLSVTEFPYTANGKIDRKTLKRIVSCQ